MESIYCGVSITNYEGCKSLKPDCFYFEIVNSQPYYSRKLDYEEACRMMWELKLAGGEKVVYTNYICPTINTRRVTYYVSHF